MVVAAAVGGNTSAPFVSNEPLPDFVAPRPGAGVVVVVVMVVAAAGVCLGLLKSPVVLSSPSRYLNKMNKFLYI